MTHHFPPQPRRRPRWAIPLTAAAVVLVVGLAGWLALSGDDDPSSPAGFVGAGSAPIQADPPTSSTLTASTTASIGPAEPATVRPPVGAFGEGPADGFYPVSTAGRPEGLTIRPGTYRSAGASGTAVGARCFWERRSGLVISRDSTRSAVTLTFRAGEFFWSRGCGSWVRVG